MHRNRRPTSRVHLAPEASRGTRTASTTATHVAARPHATPLRALLVALAMALGLAAIPQAAGAAALRTFANTYAQTLHGDIATIGNANTTCNPAWTPAGYCDPSTQATNNSSKGYGAVNDSDPSQNNSSSSKVTIPAGSTIKYARLTWGTTGDNTDGNGEQTVKFDTPPDSGYSYTNVTDADGCDGVNAASANRGVGCSADVTSLVQAGGVGTYTVANIEQRANTAGADSVDDWSGWALYIVFENPSQPLRRIVLSDGFQTVSNATPSATVALTGFTAPASGTVKASLSYAVGEGDVGITGDNATLNTTKLDTRATPDLMNSTIANLDYAQSRTPSYLNNYGFDLHNSDVTGAIANGDTSANFNFTTNGDTYYPFSTGITIDLAEPNVVLTKTLNDVNGGVVEAGDVIEYQIVAQNTGNDGATNVVLTDSIPAHSTYVPGSLQVTAGANAGTKTDAAGDDQADYDSGTNGVTFRVGTGASSSAGGLLAANTGTTTVKFRVTLDPNLGDGVQVSNTANGSYVGQTSLSSYANPSTIAATPARRADMVVAQNIGTLTAGSQSSVSLTASNTGGATTHGNAVTVTTSVPANVTFGSITSSTGWTCNTASLPSITCTRSDVLNAGASYPVITYTVTPSQTQPSASFNATVAGGNETDTTNDTDTQNITFVRSADLSLTNVADVSTANVGDTITYSVAGKNNGPSTTTGVATTATLPSTLQPLSATLGGSPCTISGQTITCTTGALAASGAGANTAAIVIKAKVLPAAGGTTVTVDPSIAGSDPDPTTANNHAAAAVTINAAGDVQVTETVAPSSVNPGSNATYTFTVKNNGPNTATGIVLTDNLPSGVTLVSATPSQGSACTTTSTFTCAIGSLASGASATVAVVVKPATSTAGTSLANPGSITSTTFDYDATNDTATASLAVNNAADLRTTVSANASTSHAGDTVDYTVTVNNDGPSTAAGASVSITLPAGATLVSVTPSTGTCNGASPRVCTLGTIASGASPTVVVRVTMTAANAGSNATLSATASETTFDPQASNDSASTSVPVTGSADLGLTETSSPATLNPGSNATYTFTVKNNGPNTATGVVLTDNLPAGVTLVSATPSQGSACTTTSTFTCALGTLLSGDSATVTVVVTPALSTAGTSLANPGSVTATTFDPNTADNSATASVSVNPAADLRTTVTATPTTASVGDTVDYLVTVHDDGPSSAAGANVALDLPDGATIVSVTPSAGVTCPSAGDPRTCTLGTLASGAAPTIAVKVTLTGANAGTNATLAAAATTSTFDPATGNNNASAASAVTAAADLRLTETVSPASVNPGSNATYTFTVKNNGPGTASGVSLSDDLPAGVSVVSITASQGGCGTGDPFSCALGTLANGASATVTVVVTPALNTAGTSLANPGTVTSTSFDGSTADNSATASVAVNDAADLRTTVTGTPATAAIGDTVDYVVTVHNDGPSSAAGATVVLDLPNGATIVSVTPSAGVTCPSTGDPRTCTLGTLASGAAPTIAVKVTLTPANAASNVTLSASASATTFDPTAGNNGDSASIAAGTTADLALTETVSPATVNANANTTYTFTVTNNGPNAAGSVTLNDNLPAGVTVVSITPSQGSCGTGDPFSCNLGTVGNGSTATVTVVVKPGTSNAGGALANPGSVTAGTPDPDPSNNSATASATVNDAADLSTTVTATPATAKVGDTVDYLVTVHNGGPQSATGATVDLNLPNGATVVSTTPSQGSCPTTGDPRTCTIGTIPSGGDVTIAVKVTLTGANAGAGAGVAATAGATTFDPTPANNADSGTVAVDQAADLKLTETVSPASANPGADVTYTFTVTNNGPGTATGVDLTDTIPAGATLVSVTPPAGVTCGTGSPFHCNVGTLPSGGSATFTVVLRAGTANAGSSMSNPVSVTSSSYDPTPGDNADSASTSVNPVAELAASATVDHTTASVGDTLTYLLTLTNNGPSPATNAALLAHLPAGATILSVTPSAGTCDSSSPRTCVLGNVAVGASATVTVKLRVEAANAGATIAVSGDVSASEYDQNTTNNSAVATSSAGDAADLAVTKTSDHPTANVGDEITWTITAKNNGPQPALGTTVGDAIPAGVTITSATSTVGTCTVGSAITCSVGTLASGASAVITVKGTVKRSAADSPLSSQASVTGSVFDPDTSNNVSTTTTTVGSASDLRLTKVIDNANPRIGDHVTWTLQVFNDGPSAATNVHLVDVVPAGAPIDSVTASAGTCTRSGQSVDCVIPTIAGGSSAIVTIKATVAQGAGGASLNNSATVTSATLDPDTSNNTSSASSTAGGAADLSVTLTPDRTAVTVGERITWNGVVANNGPQTATGTVVTLQLPDGLTDVVATTPGGTCTVTGRTVTCTVADVPVGGIQKLTISGTPGRTDAGSDLTTSAVVSSNQSDPSPADNTTSSGIVAVAPAVDLQLTKTADKAEATVGDPLTITSRITNRGPSTATDVVVTDVLPDGVELQSVSPSQGTCTISGQTITCHLGALADGQTATISTVVVVRSAGLGQRLLSGGTVSSNEIDLDASDNAADSTAVAIAPSAAPAAAPFIDFTKTVDKAAPVAGDTVVYTITAANRGNAAAQNVRVVDQLPAGLKYAGTKVTGGTCTRSASTVTCLASVLQPGLSLTAKISAVVSDGNKVIANTATVTATGLPAKPAGGQLATASLKSSGGPYVVAGVKSLEPYSRPGKTIRIAVKLTNVGEGTATGNRVCFRLPASVVLTHLPSGVSQKGGQFCMSAASLASGKDKRMVLGARVVGPAGSKKPTVAATSSNARTKAMTFPLVIRGALPMRAAGVTG